MRTSRQSNPDAWGIDWHQAETLSAFQDRVPNLEPAERLLILDTAAQVLADHYAHLPHKSRSQGTDPVARLQALRTQEADADANPMGVPLGTPDFHEAVCQIFAELHDLHTLYILPDPYAGMVAFLPFQLGLATGEGDPTLIVTHVLPGFHHTGFIPGATVLSWSGIKVERTIRRLALSSGGANRAAASARALALLTQRPMLRMPPPDAEWVELEYLSPATTKPARLRVAWRVAPLPPPDQAAPPHASAIDPEGAALQQHRKQSYAPHVLRAERAGAVPQHPAPAATHPFHHEIATSFPNVRAWIGEVDAKRFGVLRLRNFVVDQDLFIDEMGRLLSLMPPDGLVIDLRDNPGGLVPAAERLLALLTDTVRPVKVAFLATQANLELCQHHAAVHADSELIPWIVPLQDAIANRRPWSEATEMTPPGDCAGPRVYTGPVVLITSGRTYSAADIFTAGFRDQNIGRILGVDANTGAGGANMWTHAKINEIAGTGIALPHNAELRVAIRRVLRNNGQVLEEAGVPPDQVHALTRADLLEGDCDLLRTAAGLLHPGP